MKKLFFALVFLFLVSSVYANVYINEMESNPTGTDSGFEWIELYNNDSINPVNLSGWHINKANGNNITLSGIIDTNFTVIYYSSLLNAGEQLNLYDNNTILIDFTPSVIDNDNDDKSWQRVPDGIGNFSFKNSTINSTNGGIIIPPTDVSITNLTHSPLCLFQNQNVNLSANISGSCIDNVTFYVLIDGNWTSFNGINSGLKYTAIIPYYQLDKDSMYDWKVSVIDCLMREINSTTESFYVNPKTQLIISPSVPDGINGWYLTSPVFSLFNPNTINLFYQWDSLAILNYTNGTQFGVEGAPNNANKSGGILELNYWGDVCNEQKNEIIIKTDFTNPEINDIKPKNNEVIYNDANPEIFTHIDDIYQSNSGINFTSIIFKLDNVSVSPAIVKEGSSRADVYLFPKNLSDGIHEVYVSVRDNAGRQSERTWRFEIKTTEEIIFNVSLPLGTLYTDKKVPFEISVNSNLSLYYIDYSEIKPKNRTICNDCDFYNKSKNFKDGTHNVSFFADDGYGKIKEVKVVFIVDTKDPKIKSSVPKREKIFNGKNFEVTFEEQNPTEVTLYYADKREDFNLTLDCILENGKNFCSREVNLTDFGGNETEYFFEITDVANRTAKMKKTAFIVDTTNPEVKLFNITSNGKKVIFFMGIQEKNFEEVAYLDWTDKKPMWKTLCSSLKYGFCEKTKSFRGGEHDIDVMVLDKAGNYVILEDNYLLI